MDWVAIGQQLSTLGELALVKTAGSGLLTWGLALAGYPGQAFTALGVLLVLDFILGFSRAWRSHELSSAKIRSGICKFIVYGVAVVVMGLVDQGATIPGISFRDLLIAYLCINEALSALAHLSFYGVPIPRGLLERLRKYREDLEQTPTKSEEEKHV